jgi:hypothetical protein
MLFHVEVRQFPHNAWRFNLTDRQLGLLAEAWVRGEPIEFGERRWNPPQARLTIVEGPELALAQLSMGRGWRLAQKEGQDVTARVLASVRASAVPGVASGVTQPAAATGGADALGLAVQLGSLLGSDAARLLEAWRAVAARTPQLAPSESLARAEQELRGG